MLFFFKHQTLLGPQKETDRGKKCFIIDLDETLVHSSFKVGVFMPIHFKCPILLNMHSWIFDFMDVDYPFKCIIIVDNK